MAATYPLKPASTYPVQPSTAHSSPLRFIADWLRVLHRVNPVLSWVGWLHVGFLLLALVLLPFDTRAVTGLPVWVKPIKFALSGLLYLWTLAWLLADLPSPAQRAVRRISWGIGLSMAVEMACIATQAARGTTSHFNNATAFDGLLFSLMGVFILVNTLLTVWAVYLVWRYRPDGPAGYVWGVRLGLLLFLIGSVLGGMMIHLNQHTVGAPDGGPGLPGLGWSTRAGDLRIAHFLGLHALQVVPLFGWWVSRKIPSRAVLITWLGAAMYTGLVAALFAQAMQASPFLRW
ncbi:hypothetical protein SAMN06265337_0092 [Hymenobacter gelipurpurascens]|uniref:Uncharacterized protein n=1 Tax=Hymenobacter gelipurpurascens TaxID=89968 RepID=A0A212T0R1_9BACT|nr:hypothetical protein [Hymenobacter gelipurpurascens]SNC59632.1 hypothetical protein SAMN06265337_0092 [Hymenobacter gelipurpurascens]